MNPFVDFRKRSIQLPKGCKDLADVLGHSRQTETDRGPLRCEYCGAPPVPRAGSYKCDPIKKLTSYCCPDCVKDQIEFISRPENALPDDADLSDESVSRKILAIGKRLDRFMRRRVRDRKKGKDANNC